MGNLLSQPKKTYCSDYKHSDIVNAVYTILSNYQIEAMCECASWLVKELLLYKKYDPSQVELICCTVNNRNHVFVFDTLENYYIDITSEQFVDKNGEQIPPCIGSKSISTFENLGYNRIKENTKKICDDFCKESCVLYNNGKPVTRIQLLDEIKNHLGMRGGKRKKRTKRRFK